MHIAITGGAGFIGSNLARLTLEYGHKVTVIDDLSTGFRENLDNLDVHFVEGSILDDVALDRAFEGVDSVIHLAALGSVPRSIKDPLGSHRVNATGTLQVLEACRRVGISHVVGASSSSVYGLNPALPKLERDWVRPMSPYAVTKLATEQYLLAYQQSFGFESMAFRFFNVYGPGQRAGHVYAAVIPVFIDAMFSGRSLPINGDGTQSRDFTYVGTVCQILLEAAGSRMSHPEPVNLAFGTNTNLIELVKTLERRVGRELAVNHLPARIGDVPHSQADHALLRSLFPDIHPPSLEEGIDNTLRWFENLPRPRTVAGS